jgi:hypothetical protein
MNRDSLKLRPAVLAALVANLLACGASSEGPGDFDASGGASGGSGASTGTSGTGGTAATGGSGTAGSAGASGSGGAAGSTGSAGNGGASSSGSTSSTGSTSGTGGTSGGSGGASGSGGREGGMAGGSGGAGQAGAAGGAGAPMSDAGRTDGGTQSIDDCFKGLRAGVGWFQDATKASIDKRYRMRLALDTGDRVGTSGTFGWAAYRLALETPDSVVCVQEAALANAYQVTHHNCMDVLTVVVGDRKYVIQNPDSAIDYVDPNAWRRPATLTIFVGAQPIGPAVRLDTTSCNLAGLDGKCRSGGPC